MLLYTKKYNVKHKKIAVVQPDKNRMGAKMDKAKRHHAYSRMKKTELVAKALELAAVAEAMREWIDAVPRDIQLPAMPGFDREWADEVIDQASTCED
jgi:hypothetical protein